MIFPETDDEKLISKCTESEFLQKLRSRYINDVFILLSFKDGIVRSAVHLNKFHAHPYAQNLLSSVLEAWLTKLPLQQYILIPIPLSAKRERERGYNQVSNVARKAVYLLPQIILKEGILIKGKHTPPQTTLSKQERLKNLQGTFVVLPQQIASLKDKNVILLDDVTTTGATLREAKAALLLHEPASITCVALAH